MSAYRPFFLFFFLIKQNEILILANIFFQLFCFVCYFVRFLIFGIFCTIGAMSYKHIQTFLFLLCIIVRSALGRLRLPSFFPATEPCRNALALARKLALSLTVLCLGKQ